MIQRNTDIRILENRFSKSAFFRDFGFAELIALSNKNNYEFVLYCARFLVSLHVIKKNIKNR